VPAVVGDDEATAQDALGAAGLSAKLVTAESPDAPDGTVLRVVPGAGSRVGRGNTVTLYVAVSTTLVPDLTGLTADEADGQLAAIGLTPQHEPADADPDAVVTGQEPAAGQQVRQGGTVLLTLESASPGTPLPS
jgi:eukaryotic-like serine/threonine-protein kinase